MIKNHTRTGNKWSLYVPHILLLALAGSVLAKMAASPLSFCDDLTTYYPLQETINGGVPVTSFGYVGLLCHQMIFGIHALYTPLVKLFHALGAEYPMIAASKFWAMCLIPMSFGVWLVYFRKNLGVVVGAWLALAIVLFNTVNHIIPAGIARSNNVVLLGLWCIALQRRSTLGILGVLLISSVLYPLIVPVMGLTLFFATMVSWKDKESPLFRVGILAAGFVASIAYNLGNYLTRIVDLNQTPLALDEMLEIFHGGTFSANLDIARCLGRLSNQNLLEWFQYNVLNIWTPVDLGPAILIVLCVLGIGFSGIALRKTKSERAQTVATWAMFCFPVIGGIASHNYDALFSSMAWFIALASLAWLALPKESQILQLPLEIKLLIPASLVAFIIAYVVSYQYFMMTLDPGRQLQRPFAIVAPIVTTLWILAMISRLQGRRLGLVLAAACVAITLYSCFALHLVYHTYGDEKAMKALKDLPADSMILCHPQTADIVLVMAGKSTSVAHEMVRIGAQPYTADSFAEYAKDVDLVYSDTPEKIKDWCKQAPEKRYILIEENIYVPSEVKRLFGPHNKEMEKRRQDGYYLLDLESPCKRKIGDSTHLLECDCFLQELGDQIE